MPLPFEEFQGKVISSYFSSSDIEPTSVLSPLTTSSSTVSSSHGVTTAVGGGGISTAISGGGDEQCGGHGDWEQVPPPASPTHDHDNDQSILRLIMMGDSQEDPSHELNNILQTSSASQSPVTFHHSDYTSLGSTFGVVDTTAVFSSVPPPLFQSQLEDKPPHHPLLINQSQTHSTHNPSLFYGQAAAAAATFPPPAKRLNQGSLGQGTITEQLFKVAEVIESGGDTCLAQGILARLNQQLSSPVGKPFERAAFYFIEALHSCLLHNNNNATTQQQPLNPYSLIFKISAYKSFSEISPVLQFANFTSNQSLLESFHGFNRLHIIDFDIGFGGQWASLMQELVLRNNDNNAPPLSLKITVFASQDDHHLLELGFTQDNLKHFASEINISLDIHVLSLDLLLSGSLSWPPPPSEEKEAVAVNLSPSSFSNTPSLLLRFVKHLSPTIIVCSDRGCERTDLPFPQHLLHSLQSHAALLESLDAVNAMQKIERFLIQPEIEKMVLDRSSSSRSRPLERPMMTWQAMFMQMGFSPVAHSNFTESQAECLVQRTPVRGFHVEKKHNSLLLCWQRRELVGVSAWRCRS